MIVFNTRVVTKNSKLGSGHEALQVAIARGLNMGGDKVRTQVQRGLWKQTGVTKYNSITKRIRTNGAAPGRLAYVIHAMGPAIPIKEFKVRASAHGPVTANVWNNPHTFQRSFKSSARGLLRARLTDDPRSKIRVLLGPNLAKELHQGAIPDVFMHAARTHVPPEIIKAITKVFR